MTTLTERETGRLGSIATLLRRSKRTLLLIVVVALVALALSAFLSVMLDNGISLRLPSVGNIHTLGVRAFWDPTLQNQTTEIQWGTVYTGHSYNSTLYLQSISNVATTLEKKTTNWTYLGTDNRIVMGPSESTPYMNLTWNYVNQQLNPNQTIQVILTLTTDDSDDFVKTLISKDVKWFTMDIIIQVDEE